VQDEKKSEIDVSPGPHQINEMFDEGDKVKEIFHHNKDENK